MNDPIYSSTEMSYPWPKEYMSPTKEADSEASQSPAQPGFEVK